MVSRMWSLSPQCITIGARLTECRMHLGRSGVSICAGICGDKIVLWEQVKGPWNGQKAADLYTGAVKKALKRASPGKKRHRILEDNDPTGFKSKKAIKAKASAKIDVFAIPKRSPDLSVMDYAVWKKINTNMRAQEKRWPNKKRETRAEYISRLRRTAQNLSRAFVNKAIENMKERCQRLYAAKGKHFEEGGKSK